MGKNLQQGGPEIIGKSRSTPGCMWGVLHILKYHHWRHIKKRLPHKRGPSNKNEIGYENPGNDINELNTDKISDNQIEMYQVDEKTTQPAPATKSSVKSRLKALLTEELYRRKNKQRRSDSCPFHPPTSRKDSSNQLQLSNDETSKEANPTVFDDSNYWVASELDLLLPDSSEGKYSDETGNHLEHKQDDETGKQLIENHLVENSDSEKQNLAHSKELNVNSSTKQSKEALDALDMINMNKDFLMKILQDPGSPLAHLFHNQQAISRKKKYSKSQSFSSASHMRRSASRKHKPVQEGVSSDDVKPNSKDYFRSKSMPSMAAGNRMDRILKLNQAISETLDPLSSSLVQKRKNKSFKDFRHKIRSAIRQSKNEKQRITMDGILHKIPRGRVLACELKSHPLIRDGKESSISNDGDPSLPCNNKNESRRFQRTSSLCESLHRYSWLYESSFNREPKQLTLETSKTTIKDASSPKNNDSKSMRRMFSSPNLKSHVCYSDYSSDLISLNQIKNAVDSIMSTTDNVTEKSEDSESEVESDVQQNIASESNSVKEDQLGMTAESNIDPNAKLDLVSDVLDHLVTRDEESKEQDTGSPDNLAVELEEPISLLVLDSKYQEETEELASSSTSEEEDSEMMISLPFPDIIDSLDAQPVETILQDKPTAEIFEFPSNNLRFRVGVKEKAQFDYVRDILELSGFSGSELLGSWHSNDKPMDPGLFEEMEEGCMVLDPECSGNIEGNYCHHLLLFDLINEVLMEIYAKSYTYCPRSLSALSHIRLMPVGGHILEEVWANISWYLNSIPEADLLLDYIVSRDLAKNDGWMNLQFDSECVGLEIEDLIFDNLLEEIIFT
uniref:DUF4378 domain-containing protein n=2 Tax=Manihot esculenta TaxID=3983 RepID=A0A2C9V997_MANES